MKFDNQRKQLGENSPYLNTQEKVIALAINSINEIGFNPLNLSLDKNEHEPSLSEMGKSFCKVLEKDYIKTAKNLRDSCFTANLDKNLEISEIINKIVKVNRITKADFKPGNL